MALSIACWSPVREMGSPLSSTLQNSFIFRDQPPDLEKGQVSHGKQSFNSFFKGPYLFYLGERSVPACSSMYSASLALNRALVFPNQLSKHTNAFKTNLLPCSIPRHPFTLDVSFLLQHEKIFGFFNINF